MGSRRRSSPPATSRAARPRCSRRSSSSRATTSPSASGSPPRAPPAENFLGRHEPAQRRLVAALDTLPDQGSPEAVAVLLDLATGAFLTREVEADVRHGQTRLTAARALGGRRLGMAAAVLAHGCANTGLVAEAFQRGRAGRASRRSPTTARVVPRRRQPRRMGRIPHRALRRLDPPRRRGAAIARATGQSQFPPDHRSARRP